MRTLVLTTSCLALALLLASFTPEPIAGDRLSVGVSTFDLTLAAGPLQTAELVDAN